MREHLAAIRALLTAASLTSYHIDVPDVPTLPYVLVWSSSGMPGPEQSVAGAGDLTDLVGVTAVASSADNVLIVRDRVRAVLDGARPTVTGRVVWLNLAASGTTAIDRDVTPHVAYGVDQYRLISVPA